MYKCTLFERKKSLRLKNNLLKSNEKLRDVITKKMIIKLQLQNGYKKNIIHNFSFYINKKIYKNKLMI